VQLAAVGYRLKPRRRSELGLLIVGGIAILYATLLPSLAATGALPGDELRVVIGLVGIAFVVQVINRRLVPDANPVMMPVALVLNGLGYVMISRLTPNPTTAAEAGQQFAWTVIGLVVYTAVLLAVRRSRDLERYRYLMLFFAFGLLVAPILPVIGLSVGGARLWVHLGSIQFQPVELAKILLVVFFASYFIEKRELLTIPTRRVGNHLLPDLRAFGPFAVAAVMSLFVILAEHDIGFALLLFVVFLSLLWLTTGRWTYLAIGIIAFIAATFVASHLLYQVDQRITVWLDPWTSYNTRGGGYQPVQGEFAFARGGLYGSGLGLGIPGVIPVNTSDFIFAALGEELGLFGTAAIVCAFLLFIGSGLHAALQARSEFSKLCAAGLTVLLGFQAFFIMAGVTRLLPLTGVTLPFVSYGGSSLVANYALLAVLMRISDEGNQDALSAPSWSSTSADTVIGTGNP
jgi:cell division protein FtsW (lipid II flippase)